MPRLSYHGRRSARTRGANSEDTSSSANRASARGDAGASAAGALSRAAQRRTAASRRVSSSSQPASDGPEGKLRAAHSPGTWQADAGFDHTVTAAHADSGNSPTATIGMRERGWGGRGRGGGDPLTDPDLPPS